MSAADQQSLVSAFGRLTTAGYASNFKSYSGETFDVTPTPLTRGVDKVVQTKLTPSGGDPVSISYRMRQSGGTWKVIDVLYGAISQLTTRRSDFAAPLAQGGASALVAHLNALVDKDLK
jgi:phospholipid transport system substrate-binding protein